MHGPMIERVHSGQMFESVIIWSQRWLVTARKEAAAIAFVIKRIGSDQSSSVEGGRQDELSLGHPPCDGVCFRLRISIVLASSEEVGEISVQIFPVGVVSSCKKGKETEGYK